MTHQHAAKALGTSVDPYDQEIDSGSDDEESATGIVVNPLEVAAMQTQVNTCTYQDWWKQIKIGQARPIFMIIRVEMEVESWTICTSTLGEQH